MGNGNDGAGVVWRFNDNINIAPLLAVIRTRTKQPNTCTRTKNRSRSGANGGLLILA